MKKRFHKRPLVRLVIVVFVLGIVLGMLAVYGLEDKASVHQPVKITQNETVRIETFIRENNPQKIKAGQLVKTQISQSNINLLLEYIVQKMAVRSPDISKRQIHSEVILDENIANVKLSISLYEMFQPKYLNISASFITDNENDYFQLYLKSLSIGGIKLPSMIADVLAKEIHKKLLNESVEYSLVTRSIKNIKFNKRELTLNYMFDKQYFEKIKTQFKSRIIPENLKQALIAQTAQLAYSSQPLELQPSINKLLRPMFDLARERSQFSNPVVENKAVFIVLAAYSLNKNISKYFDEKNKYNIKQHKLYLIKRHDLSKHFLVSAAMASVADPELVKTIGLEKEIDDSHSESGFSFIDLAADYAGIRLAKYATENENQAREIQYKLAIVKDEAEYMPSIEKLAEGIYRPDLNSGFRSSEQYVKMESVIIERIKQLTIYQ